ncbi:MAG: hypothetical protein AAF960_03555 [Bacteroidota bacterium]
MTFFKSNNNLISNPLFLLLAFFFLAGFPSYGCNITKGVLASRNDSIPPKSVEYQGLRLQVTNIVIEKQKSKSCKISCTLINTGRDKVRLPLKSDNPKSVIYQFDHSLKNSGLASQQSAIESAISNKKFSLDVGKIASKFEVKFNIDNSESSNNPTVSTTTDDFVSGANSTTLYDKDYCPDLRIDTVFILKRSKKKVELAFKITNYGKGPAGLFGKTKETEDNVAIRAYASGTPKLSRGDLVLGGAFIEGGLEDANGILRPNESFSGSFEVETRKKTRYMPYFILSVDDYQSLWECDERNNVWTLLDRS